MTGHARTSTEELRAPLALRALSPVLDRIDHGRVRVRWTDGRERVYGHDTEGPEVLVAVNHIRAARRLLTAGAMGFAEGYIAGDWDTPDLTALLDLAARNSPEETLLSRIRFPKEYADRLAHLLRPNTRRGARKNIHDHYDLGNDFYALWLDPSMTYSCALFDGSECDMETAQRRKWDRLLSLMRPQRGDTLLEIGCGWGGFAIHAAKSRGCRVVGVTISDEQHEWASRRVAEEGLGDLVEIRLQDYRDVTGTFDHIASIEMFEAVGERHWPQFFRTVRERLRPGGTAALQTITIADCRFDDYRRRADFIQRYVFPGGMLPCPAEFMRLASEAGLAPMAPSFFGKDYALTLAEWEQRFVTSIAEVRGLGFGERFERTWRYYLAYCQAGFRNGMVDVMQVALR